MSTERDSDPFAPPEISTEVCCIHCGETYDSWQIEWRILTNADGQEHGFWCCPIAGCDGMGFGFDILPTDPDYHDEHGGWVHDDDEEDLADIDWDAVETEERAAELDLSDELPWDDAKSGAPPNPRSDPDGDFPFSVN